MPTSKQYMTLDNLTTYDGLIKQYIGTEDAKSIKYVSVSGNTVSFYKTADGSGTAAYTVTLPDVSGFMDKIEEPSTGRILVSDENGQATESEVAVDELVSGYFSDDVTNGEIVIYDTTDGMVKNSGTHLDDLLSGYFEDAVADTIVVYDGDTADIKKTDVSIDDVTNAISDIEDLQTDIENKVDKIDASLVHAGTVLVSTAEGGIEEASGDFMTGYHFSDQTSVGMLVATANQDDANIEPTDIAVDDIVTKISSPTSGTVLVSDSNGGIAESDKYYITGYHGFDGTPGNIVIVAPQGDVTPSNTSISDITDAIGGKVSKISNATGGKIVTSTAQGEITESSTAISDLATTSDLSGKMDKIANATGGKLLTSNANGTISETNVPIAGNGTEVGLVTGYFGLSGQHIVEGFLDEVTGRYEIIDTEYAVDDILSSIDNKIDKIDDPYGDRILLSDSNGGIYESDYLMSGIETMIESAQNAADAAQDDVDTLETLVGTIPQGATATTVVGYVDEAVADAASDADISLVEAQTPTTGYLKTYELYQGGNAAANLVGKIDIPKDLVVTSGEIVVNPTGQPAGTYLKLTIANQTEPVYINVADLCDVYTAASGATQVQLAISNTNEISATLVAGGVSATELASNAVTTAKIADDAVTADKVSIAAHSEIQTAAAANGNVAITVTTTDGQVSAVSASIPANTYDAYGAASGVQTSLVGTSSDPASADTINGAKAYADAATTSIPTSSIEALFA